MIVHCIVHIFFLPDLFSRNTAKVVKLQSFEPFLVKNILNCLSSFFLSRRLHDIDQTSLVRFLTFLYKYRCRFFWFDQIWLDHTQNDKIGDVFWFILVLMKEFFHYRKRTSIVQEKMGRGGGWKGEGDASLIFGASLTEKYYLFCVLSFLCKV